MAAAISLAGEVGFGELTVDKVIARSGGGRAAFYAHFAGVEACFAAGYELEAEALCRRTLATAIGIPGWRDRTRAALGELFRFVGERPLVATSLFLEVDLAGPGPRRKHDEVADRLTAAVEGPCAMPDDGLPPPNPIARAFVVGAVEGVVRSRLVKGEHEQILATLPDLMYLIVSLFEGRDAAREELGPRA